MKKGPAKKDILSHHANLFVGPDILLEEIRHDLKNVHGIRLEGNPDFFQFSYENFVIDNAREIKSLHDTRPLSVDGQKIFLLHMHAITVEAQNALLKLLEEPADYARFLLLLPSQHLLLPTVKSRLNILSVAEKTGQERNRDMAAEFLWAKPAKRLEMVKEIMDDVSKEKKTRQDVIDFLNDVEAIIYEKKGTRDGRKMLESVALARKYMNDRSPSVKMLMEFVAISVSHL